ncbi:MAG: hypothetical protein IJW45_07235, partial [Oscillospiraceae bacterium]|nr:hypothetical protein [Oscillospiraceae bacterium]
MTQTKTRSPFLIPMAALGVLTLGMIVLLIWGVAALREQAEASRVTEPVTVTTQPTTEPTPTEPEPMDPPTAEQIVAEYAQAHGLTLADYPEKLIALLERNPEAEEFVLEYPLEYGKDHEIDISGHVDDEGVPLFIQWDEQWGYKDYVGNIAGLSGCGPTCLSMVKFHFSRDPKMHPAYMMDFAQANKAYANTAGATQWALFSQGAKELGL